MSSIANVPEVINNFNAYSNGTQLIGVTASVALPNFDAITEEISGAGVMGSYETSIPGFYSSMEQEVGFRTLDSDIFELMNPTSAVDLTFRASAQSTVKATGALTYNGMRIVERGRFKSFEPGTLEVGKQMESKLKFECLYFLCEIDGETMLEYDKLNSVFIVNGVDLLEKVRSLT
ncbi:MAG: phage major tail tube protein [Lachnospiraceae bacterium]|nr:phage major tail tube protein [Lachnospiraceae bacterium]